MPGERGAMAAGGGEACGGWEEDMREGEEKDQGGWIGFGRVPVLSHVSILGLFFPQLIQSNGYPQ
jgi:hypothetical protein